MATGAALSLASFDNQPGVVAATAWLLAFTAWRTLRPAGRILVGRPTLALELAASVLPVAASGGWDSPYVFNVLVVVVLAGFGRGYNAGFTVAVVAAVALAAGSLLFPSARAAPEAASQVALVYLATGAVGGFARRLFLEAQEGQAAFADRVDRLTEANALLAQLTRVAQTLPSSLDLGNALAASVGHLRQLFDFTAAAILVFDQATETWWAEATAGAATPAPRATEELPAGARAAVAGRSGAVVEEVLGEPPGPGGLWPASRSGLYGPLRARGRLVGLVVIEHSDEGRFGARQGELLDGVVEPLALSIDNALWFERLRLLGAEGERDRLARSLHDRIGQGLAYVNLELDRLSRKPDPGPDLARLRHDVGGLLAEVRETLRQLRSRVTDAAGLTSLAEAYLPRFAERTGIEARFERPAGDERLPVPVEQEVWRVLQEALSNVERHSGATRVVVSWQVENFRGRLRVDDDGRGFDPAGLDPQATSGIMAMRERVTAIGGRLRIDSAAGRGTQLTVDVDVEVDE